MAKLTLIHFYFQNVSINLGERTRLKTFIGKLFRKEGKKLKRLNYIFCTDNELLRINQEFLGHDFFTDIITFDLSETPNEKEAEVYISVERVRENSAAFGSSIKRELARVIFHGALHICGYKDHTPKEKEKMRRKEDTYLNSYFK